MKRTILALVFVAGLTGSIIATELQHTAFAARNSSGTYALPTGNPVTSGTTITSSWANTTLTDIGTELTNSLDRAGRGAMTGPLQLASGSSGTPGLSWSSDSTAGMYRKGSGDFCFVIGGVCLEEWITGYTIFKGGSTLHNNGLIASGNGVAVSNVNQAHGAVGVGGADGGFGLLGLGTGAAIPATAGTVGSFTSLTKNFAGVVGIAGTYGDGVYGIGNGAQSGVRGENSGSGPGVTGRGATGIVGGVFSNGTDATGSTQQDAIKAANGSLYMAGANPNSTVGFSNRLTPKNTPKAWATITCTTGTCVVTDAFNVTSISTSVRITVTLAAAMGDSNYAILTTDMKGTAIAAPYIFAAVPASTTTFDVAAWKLSDQTNVNLGASTTKFSFVVFGLQ